MTPPRSQHPSARSPFVAARIALIVIAAALAFAAGCGGSKSNETPAAGNEPAPAPTTTPAPTETSATPVATGDLGTQVFVKRCVLCHGPEGRGDGIASKGLTPKPRNFHDQAYMKTRTDAQLLEVIHKGKGVMPRWEGQLSEAEIKAVLAHVRGLGTKP